MDMKKVLTILTIAFIFAITFSMWGFSAHTDIAQADETISYICIEPADLEKNEYAGATSVAVIGEDGNPLFYLIEGYYYPVETKSIGGKNFYFLRVDGVSENAYIDTTIAPIALPSGATKENALPGNLLLKENVTISLDGQTVDTHQGWTVKLIGVKDNDFFVQASLGETNVCGLVAKDNFTLSNVVYHPVFQAKREGMLNATPEDEFIGGATTDKSVLLRIILIIGIAVPAIIIAIMIFKPGRASAKTNYDRHAMRTRREEEMDYDRDRRYDREKDYSRRAPYDDRGYDDRDYNGRQDQRDYDRQGYDRGRDNYDGRSYDQRGYDGYRDGYRDDRPRDDRPRDDRDYDRRR